MKLPYDKLKFEKAVSDGNIVWRKHTVERMLARGISRDEVLTVLDAYEVIQRYDHDKPFPSVLLLGFPNSRPIHIVISFNEIDAIVFVITAYEPDLTIFESDFKTKK